MLRASSSWLGKVDIADDVKSVGCPGPANVWCAKQSLVFLAGCKSRSGEGSG